MIGRPRRQSKGLLAHSGGFATVCIATLLLAGCHRSGPDAQSAASNASGNAEADQPASSLETGYVRPPTVLASARVSGGVTLAGRADPNARIRLLAPDGNAYGATATATGSWALAVPVQADMGEFALSEVVGDPADANSRNIQGLGYFAVLPAPGRPAVRLRAGGGSESISEPEAAPQLTTVDYDSSGGAVLSGLAKPAAPVRVAVDGATPIEARPDARGWFSVPLTGILKPGGHQAVLQSAGGTRQADFAISPAAPIGSAPFHAQRQGGGWRIDWLTPGGAPQTTVVLDDPETAKP